jgi:hypothetical protein
MYPSCDIAHGSHGSAHHHWYDPGFDGALNVNVTVWGAFAVAAGMVSLTPSAGESNEWGEVSKFVTVSVTV